MPLKGYCPVKKYCQVKKGQIFNFTDVDKMCLPFLTSFLLRNLMVLFVFTYDTQKLQKNRIWKSDVINWYDFGDKKQPIWGSKIELFTWNFVCILLDNL